MPIRTESEREEELAKLRDLAPRIPQRTLFGDDNRRGIEAQISVIENVLTEKQVYKAYAPAGLQEVEEGEEEPDEDDPERSEHILDNAREAYQWLFRGDASPAEGWSELVGE